MSNKNMPSRKVPLVSGEYYHIFNRGVNKLPIFSDVRDYKRFIKSVLYYQIEGPKPRFSLFTPLTINIDGNEKIVEILCYCLMPNHFHFLLRQIKNNGITEFLGKFSNSYTKYFNIKHGRVGPILQGEFKSVLVENNEQLLHLSRYIHLNPLISGVIQKLENYQWSSYPEYLGISATDICSKDTILGQFQETQDYKQFVLDQASYGMELEYLKHHLLDPED